jgi:hypothetical protein
MLDIALSRPRPEIAFSEMGAGPVPSSNTRGLARGWLGMWPQLGDSVEATGMRSPSSPSSSLPWGLRTRTVLPWLRAPSPWRVLSVWR